MSSSDVLGLSMIHWVFAAKNIAFSIAYWYGNALYVHAHIHIFIWKGQQQMHEQHLENRSLLLNVDSATLPPSGIQTKCRWAAFYYHHLQAVDFPPQRSRDIDRLYICSLGLGFNRHFHSTLKICLAFIADCCFVVVIAG